MNKGNCEKSWNLSTALIRRWAAKPAPWHYFHRPVRSRHMFSSLPTSVLLQKCSKSGLWCPSYLRHFNAFVGSQVMGSLYSPHSRLRGGSAGKYGVPVPIGPAHWGQGTKEQRVSHGPPHIFFPLLLKEELSLSFTDLATVAQSN